MAKKAARPCTVCEHDKRHQIEIGLTHQVPARVLALRFKLGKDAILRHAKNHLTPTQRAAILNAQKPSQIDLDALRVSESEGLLANARAQRAQLQQLAELASELGDVRAAVAAQQAITGNLTFIAKLLGQLVNVHDVRHTSILLSPDYLRLRAVLLQALRPYPEAARAVGSALHALESDAATAIEAAGKTPLVIEHQAAPVPQPLPPPPC
jgi:hypothetical protein